MKIDRIYSFILTAGYRDAECGWVMVGEENHHELDQPKSSLRTALFLVIYATKRGILEVRLLNCMHKLFGSKVVHNNSNYYYANLLSPVNYDGHIFLC